MKVELVKLKQVDGQIDSKVLWKLKKKLFPKMCDPPTAINNEHGNLVTADKALKKRLVEGFEERLKGNKMESHLTDLENYTNTLCEIQVKLSKTKKTTPWTKDDLKDALKQLGNGKSRDPEGHINELFKESVAGSDLFEAVLKPMNLIKSKQQYPKILEKCNVMSIHKKKSKKEFDNYRGVFRVEILRTILDRLTYNDCYNTIDNNLTDGNVGARKQRSVIDNIFVVNAIINSVTNSDCPLIQVQVVDIEKFFLQNVVTISK